jgi:hypothetical protein
VRTGRNGSKFSRSPFFDTDLEPTTRFPSEIFFLGYSSNLTNCQDCRLPILRRNLGWGCWCLSKWVGGMHVLRREMWRQFVWEIRNGLCWEIHDWSGSKKGKRLKYIHSTHEGRSRSRMPGRKYTVTGEVRSNPLLRDACGTFAEGRTKCFKHRGRYMLPHQWPHHLVTN